MMDYIDLFVSHDDEMERIFNDFCDDRPKCECCGEVIMEDFAICVDDEWFCNEGDCKKVAMEAVWDKHKKEYQMCVA